MSYALCPLMYAVRLQKLACRASDLRSVEQDGRLGGLEVTLYALLLHCKTIYCLGTHFYCTVYLFGPQKVRTMHPELPSSAP